MGCGPSKFPTSQRERQRQRQLQQPPEGLSHVGEAVYQKLRTKHAKHYDAMWNVTRSAMVGSLQQTPPVETFTDDCMRKAISKDGHEKCDPFVNKIFEIMSKTMIWCDVMTLGRPDEYFCEKVNKALVKIAENAKEKPVIVRMMFGWKPIFNVDTNRYMNVLTKGLPEDANIQVWVGAWRYGMSWNHAKIIAVDGKYLLTGGHNLYSKTYLKKNPVHDISIEMEGEVAHDAHLFANDQWKWIKYRRGTFWGRIMENVPDRVPRLKKRSNINEWPKGKANVYAPYYERMIVDKYETPEGTVPVISVGRQAALVETDRPADDAFIAMIDSATKTIRMALQDLGPMNVQLHDNLPKISPYGWPVEYFDPMAKAMWERGVVIQIMLSNINASFGYSNGWKCSDIASEITKCMKKVAPEATDDELKQKINENLKISFIKHNGKTKHYYCEEGTMEKDKHEIANHSKFFIVDDVCSYTGSQNLYICDLAEWGVIVDDANITAKMMEDYWNPMWKATEDKSDCKVQDVMDGLKINRDCEVEDPFSFQGRKHMEEFSIALATKE